MLDNLLEHEVTSHCANTPSTSAKNLISVIDDADCELWVGP
jgi:hypothetical protein